MIKINNHYQLKNGERTIDVPRGKAFIGSSPVCAIQLPESDAQDFHAMLYWREENLFILDLKSPQGTYLNGGIINETQIFDGHELTIGTLSFIVEVTASQSEVVESVIAADEKIDGFFEDDENVIQAVFDQNFDSLETNHGITSEKSRELVQSLQAILSYKNRIIDVQTLKLQKGIYTLRSKVEKSFDISAPFLDSDRDIFEFDGSKVNIIGTSNELNQAKPYLLTQDDFTLEIKLVIESEANKLPPWWKINSKEKKEFARNFSLLFIPFLLLLILDIPMPVKEEAIVAEIFELPPKGQAADSESGGGAVTETKTASAPSKSAFSTANLSAFKSSSSAAMKTTERAEHSLNLANATGSAGGSPSLVTGSGRGLSSNGSGVSSSGKGLGHKDGVNFNFQKTKTVVMGSMDPELLRKILQQYLPQFRHCYQIELAKNEDLKGVIDLNFRIEASGKTSKIDIRSNSTNFGSTGTGCMAKVLEIIPFPKPKGGGVVDVRQPLNFYSENG